MLVVQVNIESLGLSKATQAANTTLAPNTALLGATKWDAGRSVAHAVISNHTAFRLRNDTHGLVNVLGEDTSKKAVLGVVGLHKSLLLGLEGIDDGHGTENLSLHDFCIFWDIREGSRRDKVALYYVSLKSDDDLGNELNLPCH